MNRIIIIGNGFDLAHNLKTGYQDFINDYWATVEEQVYGRYWQWLDQHYEGSKHIPENYKDNFVCIEKECGKTETNKVCFSYNENSPFGKLCTLIDEYNNVPNALVTVHLKFKNRFFERISRQCSLINWVDIENEYYDALKELLQEENLQKQNESIRILNKEFDDVKGLLEEYLARITENTELKQHQSIQEAFSSFIELDEIATCKQIKFVDSIFSSMFRLGDFVDFELDQETDAQYTLCDTNDEKRVLFLEKNINSESFKKNHLVPYSLILNFNYTKTAEKLYVKNNNCEVINIHGELNNENNPIIFGYGDELDDDYERIDFRLQLPGCGLFRQLLRGPHDLRAAAVVDGNVQGHAGLAGRVPFQFIHHLLQFGIQRGAVAQKLNADIAVLVVKALDEVLGEQLHDGSHLFQRALPVLGSSGK